MHAKGEGGLPRDRVKAAFLLRQAAARGVAAAAEALVTFGL